MKKNYEYIAENVLRLQEKLSLCADKVGRNVEEIKTVAVAKFRPADEVYEVVKAGIGQIGENRVQEAIDKYCNLQKRDFELRFVGHLQANKASKAVGIFDTIDSVNSIRLARKLDGVANEREPFPILIQVNISGEKSKSGFSPPRTGEAIDAIGNLKNLSVMGLMTIGPLTDEKKVIRNAFRKMKELFEKYKKKHAMTILSMGMTEDFSIAIEEGSTMIRVGRALFERGWL